MRGASTFGEQKQSGARVRKNGYGLKTLRTRTNSTQREKKKKGEDQEPEDVDEMESPIDAAAEDDQQANSNGGNYARQLINRFDEEDSEDDIDNE